MVDNSLRVNPDALVDGAQQLKNTHEELTALLTKVAAGQDSLRAVWTGSAASRANSNWSTLHDAFTAHIDQLADHAQDLHTAATAYRDRDQQSQAALDQQM
ncbi:WXG100 family type VII secretion target [Mycolicibacterium fluoranthenivorans]|uniref:ESAT-6-like protein n=1 Tax=Mycolicibacterium fluoranthenivorans TaxID=258505 RepID=A0A7G8PKJ8_9MYCO|nr:WXG100 family type VII secretion target [Mycolicibacterium fluoranthenivorans]QNJ94864.1 WXG100 family type VII secretion target [Mycolicibacterium fluoranthenivorans]